ncbi:MAG: Asp-tRNA(Asn)/Glu-tRNA(Gln) amidotransferase subunit GatC [Elusimicrobia bacterium]|nr:Asp-tRNA(Asn)/Glu-tRNA(Gln) amidotransferase subunit GatC [Elusimicrobiota bacterium]
MAITQDDVRKIAKLARLRLTSDEVGLYQAQLGKILDSMAELSRLDTSKVPPTASVLGQTDATREDFPEPFANASALIGNAPDREGSFFKVRKVIE